MKKFQLNKLDSAAHSLCKDKEEAQQKTVELQRELYDLLYLMFAHNRYSLLIILQGIDSSGKDGAVRHLFSAANPQGIKVFSFKQPTAEESRHDFLWRCHQHTPESGLTAIFNRSYYEEVTTTMVHPELLEAQHLPESIIKSRDFFQRRYERINEFELLLSEKGTIVLKFFLHISKKEQKRRLQERLTNRSKNWKFSAADIKERAYWDAHRRAFEKMLGATHTKVAPWHVIPADNKWYRDYLLSKTIVDKLKALKMQFPKPQLKP